VGGFTAVKRSRTRRRAAVSGSTITKRVRNWASVQAVDRPVAVLVRELHSPVAECRAEGSPERARSSPFTALSTSVAVEAVQVERKYTNAVPFASPSSGWPEPLTLGGEKSQPVQAVRERAELVKRARRR